MFQIAILLMSRKLEILLNPVAGQSHVMAKPWWVDRQLSVPLCLKNMFLVVHVLCLEYEHSICPSHLYYLRSAYHPTSWYGLNTSIKQLKYYQVWFLKLKKIWIFVLKLWSSNLSLRLERESNNSVWIFLQCAFVLFSFVVQTCWVPGLRPFCPVCALCGSVLLNVQMKCRLDHLVRLSCPQVC